MRTPPRAAVPNWLTRCDTISPSNEGPTGIEVSAGSAPVRFVPSSLPLPQFGSHWSKLSCAAKRVAGKPQANGWDDGESLATQPTIGTATICLVPRSRLVCTNDSRVFSGAATMFSKYQSLPVLYVWLLTL